MTKDEDNENDEDNSEETCEDLPETGWAWWIVFGSFIIHLIVGGLMRSGGVLFIRFTDRFHQSAADTAWAVSLNATLRLLFGPLASLLCNRFSCRSVVIVGGMLTTTGILVTGFADNLWFTFFSNGLLSGLGQAFSYTSAVVIVGLYFHKRRSTAVGIANAGIGGGTFIFPPLVEFLFRELGFQGAFLIIAGLVLQGCVAGGLFRPISLQRKVLLHQKNNSTEEYDQLPIKQAKDTTRDNHSVHLSTRDVIALSYLSLDYDINIRGSFEHLKKQHERRKPHIDNLKIPHIVNLQRLTLLGRERTESDIDIRSDLLAKNNGISGSTKSLPNQAKEMQMYHPQPLMKKGTIPIKASPLVQENGKSLIFNSQILLTETNLPQKDKMQNSLSSSIFEKSYENIEINVTEVASDQSKKAKLFEPALLKNVRFLSVCLSIGLMTLSFQSSYVFLPSLAIEKGLSELQGTYLVSIAGVLELIGSVTTGFILDIERIRPHRLNIYTLALLLMGACIIVMPYLHYFILYALVCGVYGYLLGMCIAQKPTFVIEVIGVNELVSGFGILVWFQGLGTLIGPPLSGCIKDLTGRYEDGFLVGGAMLLLGTIIQLVERVYFHIKYKTD